MLTIPVTNFYMCYKYLPFHFLYDIFSCAEDFNFNMVKGVSFFLYGLSCVYVCVLFRKSLFYCKFVKIFYMFSAKNKILLFTFRVQIYMELIFCEWCGTEISCYYLCVSVYTYTHTLYIFKDYNIMSSLDYACST